MERSQPTASTSEQDFADKTCSPVLTLVEASIADETGAQEQPKEQEDQSWQQGCQEQPKEQEDQSWQQRCQELERQKRDAEEAVIHHTGLYMHSLKEKDKELQASRQHLDESLSKSEEEKKLHETTLMAVVRDKDREIEDVRLEAARLRADLETTRLTCLEAKASQIRLAAKDRELEEAKLEVAKLRAEKYDLLSDVRARDLDLESTRLVLRGAKASQVQAEEQALAKETELATLREAYTMARRDDSTSREALDKKSNELVIVHRDLQTKTAELDDTREQYHKAMAELVSLRAAHREELSAKESEAARARQELELAAMRRELRDALNDLLAKRAELHEERQCRIALDEHVGRLENAVNHLRQMERGALESTLVASRTHLSSAMGEAALKQRALEEEKKHSSELERRVQSLELALASAASRRQDLEHEAALCGVATRQAARAERALSQERARAEKLEASLQVSSAKEEQLQREAEIFKSRGDHQEVVNNLLRLDLQEALSGPASPHSTLSPAGSWSTTSSPRPGSAGRTRRPVGGALLGASPVTGIRAPAFPNPSSPMGSPHSARMDYPKSSVSRKLRKEVLTSRPGDRTSALSRYDSKGNLISYDAMGRPVA